MSDKENKCCDYAHYYFGSRFRFTWPDGEYVETRLDYVASVGCFFGEALESNINFTHDDKYFEINDFRKDGNFQLFLLHTSEMSPEQVREYYKLCMQYIRKDSKLCYADTPESLEYLLRNHVDCFDLLKDGHALHLSIVTPLAPSPDPQPP